MFILPVIIHIKCPSIYTVGVALDVIAVKNKIHFASNKYQYAICISAVFIYNYSSHLIHEMTRIQKYR